MDGIDRVEVGSEDEGAPVGKRARKRDSLFLSARLAFGAETRVFDVRVRNLSEGGLMAELDRRVEPGALVNMEMRGLGEMTGRVAWCAHGRIGISLDQPVDPARARKPIGAGKRMPNASHAIGTRPR